MKTLIVTSALAIGLILTGSAQANASIYNSKTTQNVSHAPASGGAFSGTYLSSKAGSGLVGPSEDLVAPDWAINNSSVAINTTYNTKTMRLVAFAPPIPHVNATGESSVVASTEKPAGKNVLQSGSDVAMK